MKYDKIKLLYALEILWLTVGVLIFAVPTFIVMVTEVGFSETVSHTLMTFGMFAFILWAVTNVFLRKTEKRSARFSLIIIICLALAAVRLWL